MIKYLFAFTISIAFLFGCKKEAKPVFPAGNIGFNECAAYPDKQLEICLTGIKDYICPCDVICVWAGSIDADLLIKRVGRADTTINMSSNPTLKKDTVSFDGYLIRLTGVHNPVACPDVNKVEAYSVSLTIE